MSREKNDRRVDVSGAVAPLKNNPFEILSAEGLPEGRIVEEVTEPKANVVRRGRVVLRKEKAGRGGKTVTVVGDFEAQISDREIDDLARSIRKACGCGGAVKGREIEVQGEPLERLRVLLSEAGYRVAGVK